eukprot:PhM_4_TR15779/c0_g1_i1/m.40078
MPSFRDLLASAIEACRASLRAQEGDTAVDNPCGELRLFAHQNGAQVSLPCTLSPMLGVAVALASSSYATGQMELVRRLFCPSATTWLCGVVLYVDGQWVSCVVDAVEFVQQKGVVTELWPLILQRAIETMSPKALYSVHSTVLLLTAGVVTPLPRRIEGVPLQPTTLMHVLGLPNTVLMCQALTREGGLVRNGIYSVRKIVCTSDGAFFVRVRNPWTQDHPWQGPYATDSRDWDDNPTHAFELAPEYVDDGCFWVHWDDFATYFGALLTVQPVDGTWTVESVTGERPDTFFSHENTFLLDIAVGENDGNGPHSSATVPVVISAGQELLADGSSYPTLHTSIFELHSRPEYFGLLRDTMHRKITTQRSESPHVDDELLLAAGCYSIVPQLVGREPGTRYTLRVCTPPNVTVNLTQLK